jgi:low temperature requirement protein LtrA
MLLGVIAMAAGLKDAIGHAFDPLDLAHALMLSGGAALFLAGDLLFRRTLHLGPATLRATATGLALATVPLGLALSALAQLTTLVLVLAATLALERRTAGAGG